MILVMASVLSAILLMVGAVVLVNHDAERKMFLWLGLSLGLCSVCLLVFCGVALTVPGVMV